VNSNRTRFAVFGTALFAAGACACSLLGLDNVDAGLCTASTEASLCSDLNTAAHTEGQCFVFRCSKTGNGCERLPRDRDGDGAPDATTCAGNFGNDRLDCDDSDPLIHPAGLDPANPPKELCDGLDNDCDGQVDENASGPAPQAIDLPKMGGAAAGALVPLLAATGSTPETAPWLTLTQDRLNGGATKAVVNLGEHPMHFRLPVLTRGNNASGCPFEDNVIDNCDVRDMSVAVAGDQCVAAAINGVGRGKGQLRIGPCNVRDDQQLEIVQEPTNSNVALGVDGPCPTSGHSGAIRPSIATLSDAEGAQAMVLWIGSAPSTVDTACSKLEPAASIHALGLWVHRTSSGSSHVVASDRGQSLELPHKTESSARPALIAWQHSGTSGYVSGYAGEEGTLVLQPWPALSAVATPTDGLISPSPCVVPMSDTAPVTDVALATGSAMTAGPLLVGVAVQTGCDDKKKLFLQEFSLDAHANECTLRAELLIGAADADNEIRAPSAVIYDAKSRSWLVAWVERGSTSDVLRAKRVKSSQGKLEVVTNVVLLRADSDALSSPVLFLEGNAISWVIVNQVTATLFVGGSLCPPSY
jgi:hypothetical protein